MRIGVKGQEAQVQELNSLLSRNDNLVPLKFTDLESYDVIFDLDFDDDPIYFKEYTRLEGKVIFVGAVKRSLEAICSEMQSAPKCHFIGFNSLPSFIDRELFECASMNEEDKLAATGIFNNIGLVPSFVQSRVGLVTPRIVCMIINEAYFTVQEGTASKEDIDLGMKLGTAYPRGPFEWCDLIGIGNVYKTLAALYEDTKDERYKICPALKLAFLKSGITA